MESWKSWILSPVSILLRVWTAVCKVKIPHPSESFILWIFNNDKLAALEYLSDVFFLHGVFLFHDKFYLLDPKLSLKAINKLDKGASDYLPSSPLKNSFLNAADKSPDIRHVIATSFRKSSIEQKTAAMVEVINETVAKMAKTEVVNMSDLTLKMALDIVGKVLLSHDLKALDGKQDRLLEDMMTILHRAYALGEVATDSNEFRASSESLDRLTDAILSGCLERSADDNSLVCQLYKAGGVLEAKSNLKLFLMAGSETTASSIPLMLYVLAERPGLQGELQEEADEWIDRIQTDVTSFPPKLESAMKELLRTYAIAPYISRRTETEMDLGEVTIPAQSDLRIFMWAIHRSPHLWHSAKEYHPTRFMMSQTHGSQSKTWIPFGAGSRVCIGQHLAWLEMRLALTFFLHHFHFRRVAQTKEMEFCVDWEHAVVHPDRDVILGVQRR